MLTESHQAAACTACVREQETRCPDRAAERRDHPSTAFARLSGISLGQMVVLVLLGAFTLILLEVRYMHEKVLSEHTIAWVPIIYSGLMLVVVAGAPRFLASRRAPGFVPVFRARPRHRARGF